MAKIILGLILGLFIASCTVTKSDMKKQDAFNRDVAKALAAIIDNQIKTSENQVLIYEHIDEVCKPRMF